MNIFKKIEESQRDILNLKANLYYCNEELVTTSNKSSIDIIVKEVNELSKKLMVSTTTNRELTNFVIESTIFPIYPLSEILIDLLLTCRGVEFKLVRSEKDGFTNYCLIDALYAKKGLEGEKEEDVLYLSSVRECELDTILKSSVVSLYDIIYNGTLEFMPSNCPIENETYDVVKDFIEQYIESKYDMSLKGENLSIEAFYKTYKEQLINDANEDELARQYGEKVEYYHDYVSNKYLKKEKDKNKRIKKRQLKARKLIKDIEEDMKR